MISIIAAMDENRTIGIENRLPWRLPADLQYFKKVTLNKPVLMGRKTWDSIGRPLPGRRNMVVTRDSSFHPDGCEVFYSVDDALSAARGAVEIMVIGGASFYAQLLPRAQRLYITLLRGEHFHGDAHFPAWSSEEWQQIWREDHQRDEKNPYDYSFIVYERQKARG